MKAIILKYDEERHDYIVEDLDDDRHLVIKESQLQNLKLRLGRVRMDRSNSVALLDGLHLLMGNQITRNSMRRSCNQRSRNPSKQPNTTSGSKLLLENVPLASRRHLTDRRMGYPLARYILGGYFDND